MKVFKRKEKSVSIVNLCLDFEVTTASVFLIFVEITCTTNSAFSLKQISHYFSYKMRTAGALILLTLVAFAVAMPFPQNFDEAVRQAQQMSLIPSGAVVDRTSSGIQVAYFKLGDNDRVNPEDLRSALEGIPPEIVASLESQVANVGRNL